ncbi:sulfurtransferase TusA family protein [Alphaproteobacteria bacterium]|jgi:tRNA 2-thiouridine synthesizing protein A|nr:sulfurtransferase TusA family protein [Alphaproteobacteria bacterium]
MSKPVDSASHRQTADISLDLTGLKCPLPVLKARRQVGMMAAGSVLEVTADDPAAPLDFDHFCETSSHRLIGNETIAGVFHIRIEVGS